MAKLKIIANSDINYKKKVGSMEVQLNPNSISHSLSIEYDTDRPKGSSKPSAKYASTNNETLSFELIFDGTGVVGKGKNKVHDQIDTFRKLTAYYNGDIHEPNYLIVSWGKSIQFACRLQSLDVNYTLFEADGTPLRAEASATFIQSTSPKKQAKMQNKSSPDLTHVYTVQGGDTLPELCEKVYGESYRYLYPQVAQANGLTGLRGLTPGMTLRFPKLKTV